MLICIISWIVDTHRFVVRYYEFTNSKLKKNIRFVLLTDLHNKQYGKDNEQLVNKIRELNPEAILIGGDLLNGIVGKDFSPALRLVEQLKNDYTIYYGLGNHEYRLKIYPELYGSMWDDFSAALESMGVHMMDNERAYIPEYNVDIAAVSIDRIFYKRFRRYAFLSETDMEGYLGSASKEAVQILIAHNPEYFKAYSEWGADLTVSGHVHGGMVRLPLIGGVVSPNFLGFPKYSNGQYSIGENNIVVSCGMGTHTINVRVFNPAELSVIDLKTE